MSKTFRFFFFNSRPKICLDKCDKNLSENVSMDQPQQTDAANNNNKANDSPVCQNSICIDLTDGETKADDNPPKQQQQQPSEIKVPKEYEHILQRPAFVKLIKYENIEEKFKASEPRTPNKR